MSDTNDVNTAITEQEIAYMRLIATATAREDELAVIYEPKDEQPYDGEQLGSLVFDVQHVTAGHSGLWVYPAGYDDAQFCQGRADHLSECFDVRFYAVPLKRIGDEVEWYAATGASNTAALRRIIGRAMARAAALRGPDGEVRP